MKHYTVVGPIRGSFDCTVSIYKYRWLDEISGEVVLFFRMDADQVTAFLLTLGSGLVPARFWILIRVDIVTGIVAAVSKLTPHGVTALWSYTNNVMIVDTLCMLVFNLLVNFYSSNILLYCL